MDKDQLYIALVGFSRLSMDTQGEVTIKLHSILDSLSGGVWNKIEGGMRGHFITQCSFCCRPPGMDHLDWCPVKLAKELSEQLEDEVK